MKHVVLDDIAYESGTENGRPLVRTATKGDVVELTAKDAAALGARGAVRCATPAEAPNEVEVTVIEPNRLKE